MSKYRLKDAELQKKFDEISNGDFSRGLRRFIESGYLGTGPNFVAFGDMQPCGFADGFGNFRRFSVCLLKHELEIVKEYNPNDWNKFPDVTPPEGVLMRCVIKKPGRNLDSPEPELPKICARTSGVWDGKRWQFFGHGSLCEGSTVEYRPWE